MDLLALPAFEDNYIWVLRRGNEVAVVDPGDAAPVRRLLAERGWTLQTILVTHHHGDHTGGVAELRAQTGARVLGPARESIPQPATGLAGGDVATALGERWRVIDVPGHTAGHIAFFGAPEGAAPILFSGDTLFSGGCGRLFEGTPAQMLASLDALAALPAATRVCCGHEYTLANLRFAAAVEPDNAALADYAGQCRALRARGLPTLPSTLAVERAINPFLRSREPAVRRAVAAHAPGTPAHDDVAVFAALRQWKNDFR